MTLLFRTIRTQLLLLSLLGHVFAWSSSILHRSVRLPLIKNDHLKSSAPCSVIHSTDLEAFLCSSFLKVVDSSDFLIRIPNNNYEYDGSRNTHTTRKICSNNYEETTLSSCDVPAFGENVQVHLKSLRSPSPSGTDILEYALTVSNGSEQDFGWICTKFYEDRAYFQERVDTTQLRTVVAKHHSSLPPHPGYNADSANVEGFVQIHKLFAAHPQSLKHLLKNGYVILDTDCKTDDWQHEKLSTFLVEKTGQDPTVRTDMVHFLMRQDAIESGMQTQFDLLMGMAWFLNTHLKPQHVLATPYEPLLPGTLDNPLTLPRCIQLAEYGYGDFYTAHSDNSFDDEDHENQQRSNLSNSIGPMQRRNFRYYTCILYLNENWCSESDGGALRLYPGTRDLVRPSDAPNNHYPYIDIAPANGRMILFDSCLVHSVEKVTTKTKTRRALTLWILRPEQNGARGEIYY